MWKSSILIKNIRKLEQLQRRAMKYILSDYIPDYKTQLIHLRLFPLMYIFEISDILFFIKNLKHPTNNFNINTYVSFTVGNTRSCGLNFRPNASSTNKERHFYFNRISRLWNSLPIIDLNLPMNHIKRKIWPGLTKPVLLPQNTYTYSFYSTHLLFWGWYSNSVSFIEILTDFCIYDLVCVKIMRSDQKLSSFKP